MKWLRTIPMLATLGALMLASACETENTTADTGSVGLPDASTGGVSDGGPGPGPVPPAGGSLDASLAIVDAGPRPSSDGATDEPPVGPPGAGFIRGPAPTVESASKNGPYQVKSATEGFRRGTNYGSATLWWPEGAEPPYAFAAVVPGFVSVQGQIMNWGSFLASHGIVAITIDTVTPVDLPDNRSDALLDALKTVAEENTRSGSPLAGKLDLSRQSVIGWSMGGGGALLAAAKTPSLKATISLAGWNPGHAYADVKVPALLFATPTDALAGGQSSFFYDTIPASTPKLYWEADNVTVFFGGHDTFNDPANLDGAVGRYGLSWLKVFLEGDERYRPFLKQGPPKKVTYKTNL